MVQEFSIRPPWTTTMHPSTHLRHRIPQPATDRLSALPPELIVEICRHLHGLRRVPPTSPLTVLCRVSRTLHAIGTPVLYHRVSHDIRSLKDVLALLNFSQTARKSDTVRLVRHLALKFQFQMFRRLGGYEAPFVDAMGRFLTCYSEISGLGSLYSSLSCEQSVDLTYLVLLHLIVPKLSGLETLDADVGGRDIFDPYIAHAPQPPLTRKVKAPRVKGPGLPKLRQVSIKTRNLPKWAYETLTFFLRSLIGYAPNIQMLEARLLVARESNIVRSPTSSLRNITHLDLRGLGLPRIALEPMLLSCGRLVSFKFRMADGELSMPSTVFVTDADVPAILNALRPSKRTLETLMLEVAEYAVHTQQLSRQRMGSLRSFGALKHLSLDSYCYEESQPLGALLPASLAALDVVCLHATMHEEMKSLARSAGRARGLRSVTMYPWPNSDIRRTDIVEIGEIAGLFRDRGAVFSFSHRMSLSPCETERRRFHDRLRQWDERYLGI